MYVVKQICDFCGKEIEPGSAEAPYKLMVEIFSTNRNPNRYDICLDCHKKIKGFFHLNSTNENKGEIGQVVISLVIDLARTMNYEIESFRAYIDFISGLYDVTVEDLKDLDDTRCKKYTLYLQKKDENKPLDECELNGIIIGLNAIFPNNISLNVSRDPK